MNATAPTAQNAFHDIVVIGGSAGALDAMVDLVKGLPADYRGSVFIVSHIGANPSQLPELLDKAGRLPAAHVARSERIVPGRVYIDAGGRRAFFYRRDAHGRGARQRDAGNPRTLHDDAGARGPERCGRRAGKHLRPQLQRGAHDQAREVECTPATRHGARAVPDRRVLCLIGERDRRECRRHHS